MGAELLDKKGQDRGFGIAMIIVAVVILLVAAVVIVEFIVPLVRELISVTFWDWCKAFTVFVLCFLAVAYAFNLDDI